MVSDNSTNYALLRSLISKDTPERAKIILDRLNYLGLNPRTYTLESPRGKDLDISVRLEQGAKKELWLTANYDTFKEMPSANNNASGVVTLLSLLELNKKQPLPINLRVLFFDAGLDSALIEAKKRDSDFRPGSEIFLDNLLSEDIDFIDSYVGAIVIQAVGKGQLHLFDKTGKRYVNSKSLNKKILNYAKALNVPILLSENSPNADNISFLKQGLEATVLTRYDEGAWHKMQTPKDDLTNVNVSLIGETADFIHAVVSKLAGEII
jgi:hypothetical protein